MDKKDNKSMPQIHILEASAGSGKTYALAKHYLKLIINPEETSLNCILAITFTNKASIEMKTRIFELLKNVALDSFAKKAERDDILASLGVTPVAAQKKAFETMDYIIKNYNSFRVQTVDSFIKDIISGSSFRLGLSSRFDIRTDHNDYISRSLDLLIENSTQDNKAGRALKEFIDRYLNLENKSGWMPQKNILTVVADLYGKANTFGGGFNKIVEYSSKDIFALKRSVAEKMKALFGALPERTHKGFREKLMKVISEEGGNFSVAGLGKYFLRDELPLNAGAVPSEKAGQLWSGIRHGLTKIAAVEAFSFYNCYIDIYELVMGYFEALSHKDDIMFLGELNRRANGVFTGGVDVVPELYYRLSSRFKHFLIDEFQDTSVIQWKNVVPIASEILSEGGSLFYVGDKKQAIYRFRGGDAALFDAVPKEFPHINSKVEILGKNYRSARELVKFNNNVFSKDSLERFIAKLGADDEEKQFSKADTHEALSIYSGSSQEPSRDTSGYVRIKSFEARNNDERDNFMEAELVTLLKSIGERRPYGDIAVLARKNDDLELFTGWLLKNNIPAESEKTLDLRENGIIKEIISFLLFLDSPVDNAAFASFLLGNIYAKASGAAENEMERFIFDTNNGHMSFRPKGEILDSSSRQGGIRNDNLNHTYLYTAFRKRYPEKWNEYFEEFFVSVGFMPVYELLVSMLSKFRVTSNFGRYQGFISHLLELVKENEKERRSLKAFLEYYQKAADKDVFVKFSGTDSVRLTTIHKSKGLEFPVVIIPYLTMDISGGEGRGTAGSYYLNKTEKGLSLVKLNKDCAAHSPELGNLYSDNRKNSLIDELNTVYVSLTRAKDELYAYMPAKNGVKKNLARVFIDSDYEAGAREQKISPLYSKDFFKTPSTLAGEGGDEGQMRNTPLYTHPHPDPLPSRERGKDLNILPETVYGDWIKILKDEFTGTIDIENLDAASFGEAVHYALSLIGNLTTANADAELSKAIIRLNARYPLMENAGRAAERARAAVGNKQLKDIFFNEGAEVFNEQEILDKNGITKRVDRLVVGKDKVLVVDYKSAKDDIESHKQQVSEYIELLKVVYPAKSIEGRLVYLDTMTLEKVK